MTQYKTQRAARKAWEKAIQKLKKKKTVHILQFHHDEWCGIYQSKECNCNPDRVALDVNGKEIVKVSGAGFFDPLDL